MRNNILHTFLLLLIIVLTSCKPRLREPSKITDGVPHKPEINTIEEIKVYNDFIDQVYKVYYCHLEMDSPDEYQSYHENLTQKEIRDYEKKFDIYIKNYYKMLDTLQITAIVPDSLLELKGCQTYLISRLDSSQFALFSEILLDTLGLEKASFCLDSLKGEKTYFERIPSNIPRHLDWNNMPHDTLNKYTDLIENFCQSHFGRRIDKKYYVGFIDLSRVKFNHDSTLCFLECGYTAQSKCGYGRYYLLKKENGKWVVVTFVGSWVS